MGHQREEQRDLNRELGRRCQCHRCGVFLLYPVARDLFHYVRWEVVFWSRTNLELEQSLRLGVRHVENPTALYAYGSQDGGRLPITTMTDLS